MGAERTAPLSQRTISRRQLVKYGAWTGAAVSVGPMLPAMTSVAHAGGLPRVLPAPKPIPGGIQIPGGPLIHVFAPGPPEVTLPFTGIQLMGLDVEPSVITDYRGFTALAFHVGTPPAATVASTTWRPTCGRWKAPTSPPTAAANAACSPSYELTCSSPVRAPRSTT